MDELSKIIIVEDDDTIRTILEMALLGAGYRHVQSAARGDEGLRLIESREPDLVLLDRMLPGLDGLVICQRIRENPRLASTRIIMLTARSENEDIIEGLSQGADDYITKPFDRAVLLARIAAVLRRGATTRTLVDYDGLVVDASAATATLRNEKLSLTPGEFKILTLFLRNPSRVLTRPRILESILKDDEKSVTERTVDVQIATLRRKLGDWSTHIETIRGIGYRILL